MCDCTDTHSERLCVIQVNDQYPNRQVLSFASYFEGLPVPSSLFLTSMMAWCVKSGNFLAGAHGDVLGGRIHLFGDGKVGSLGEVHVASFVFAIWGALMVSKTLRVSCLVTAENNTDMLDPQVLIASQHPTSTVHRDTCLES